MARINTPESIEEFANKLVAANIELPSNVVIEFTEKEYNEIVPIELKSIHSIEYNAACGIKFHIRKE